MGKLPASLLPSHDGDTSLLPPDVWFHTCQEAVTPAGCPTIHLVLASSTRGERQVPHVKGSVPHRSPPFQGDSTLKLSPVLLTAQL